MCYTVYMMIGLKSDLRLSDRFQMELSEGQQRQVVFVRAEEVIQEVAKLCNSFHAKEVILYGSRAKGTARERSDIDIAVSGIEDFEALIEKVEDLPTLYSVDLVNMDTCKNQLLLEDIRQYGRKI